MHRTFIRFSTPGGKGYIPGTSKYQFREEWIDIESITWDSSDSLNPTKKSDKCIGFSCEPGKTSEYFARFFLHGTVIDKVIIEMAKPDGGPTLAAFFRITLERARIDSVAESAQGSSIGYETVLLFAGKMTAEQLSYSPADMKRAGLDPTLGIRPAAPTP